MAKGLIFEPDIPVFSGQRAKASLTILSGGNNSGKSAILKRIKQQLGKSAYLIGPSRFYHVHQIGTQQKNPRQLDDLEIQFQDSYFNPDFNYEQNLLDLNSVIAGLSDKNRDKLFEICGELIGSKFSLKKEDPNNELSMRYIDMDGQSVGLGSTGTRILLTLIGICLDTRFNTILIDEPELGLSPKVQEAFSTFLQDTQAREEIFPHISNVYIATHSHLFLDKNEPQNNFVVEREQLNVKISQIETISELHRLQFNLLGNSLERISLPSAILITEGPSDLGYLKRVIELKFPNRRITIVSGLGDVKAKVHSIKDMLGGDLQKSPYRDRLFVVVDSVHAAGLSSALEKMGVRKNNLVIWDKNGIEYLYPLTLLSEIYGASQENILKELTIKDDDVIVRDTVHRKIQLGEEVTSKLQKDTILPEELIKKLITPLEKAIS